MDKNLLCEHPAIIFNPYLKAIMLNNGNYTFRGRYHELSASECAYMNYEFPYGRFGTRNNNITHDDLESCYITDYSSGELIPMYYEVPCGKCTLCRDKSAREWSTRAMCESQTSNGYPLFVTLTYNNHHLPEQGVVKEHAQNFMKRLRINLNRYLGRKVNLRMFLCAEYGSKHKRPHYHALIWNFPALDTLKRTLSIFEKSWSYVVDRNFKHDKDDYVFYDEFARRYRAQYGFVHLQLAQGGHVYYCMKYMRKDAVVPKGKNDVFYLASRRRGLGFEWLDSHKQEFINNPHLSDVTFKDKWSMVTFKAAMPSYFKGILYPTISKVLPKDIRDKFHCWVDLINQRNVFIGKQMVYYNEVKILAKFSCLHYVIDRAPYKPNIRGYELDMKEDFATYEPVYQDACLVDVKRISVPSPDAQYEIDNIIFKRIIKQLDVLHKELEQYDFNVASFDEMSTRKNIRLYWLGKKLDLQPERKIVDAVREIKHKRQLQINREIF